MNCNFCNKEFNIKAEWLKKSLLGKIKDSLSFWATFDFDARTDVGFIKGVLLILGQVGYMVLSAFLILFALGGFFVPFMGLNQNWLNNVMYVFMAIILLLLFLSINYWMFKKDVEGNFKKIFNSNDASIKCPSCGNKNKLKINYLK